MFHAVKKMSAAIAAVWLCLPAAAVACETASKMPVCASGGFDTASAWVTGVRFAMGANRDRRTPPPRLTVRFRKADGGVKSYSLGKIIFKNRHYLQRRFSRLELTELKDAQCLGFSFEGLSEEDKGISFCDARLFKERFSPIDVPRRAKRNLTPLKNQDLGNNTGEGFLPFPVREKTVQPIAASAKTPLAVLPRFTASTKDPAQARYLEVVERREGRVLIVDLFAPAGKVTV